MLFAILLFLSTVKAIAIDIHLLTDVVPEKGLYTTNLYLGTPIKSVKFQVSFRVNDLLLFYDAREQSVSYSEFMPSDLFYFGSRSYRLSARIGNSSEKATFLTCSDCKGILGLGPDSVFWDIWPSISFSYGGIHLGDDKNSFLIDLDVNDKKRFCELEKLICNHDDVGICTTTAIYENQTYRLRFMGDHPYLHVPRAVYEHYFQGKNVYRDRPSDWKPLQFLIPNENFQSMHAMCDHEEKFDEDGGYQFEFDFNELVFVQNDGTARIIVKENVRENDTIELGIQLWRRFMIRKTTAFSNQGHILIKKNVVNQHANTFNLILVVILAVSWIRWNLTGMPGHFVFDVENCIYYVLEFGAIVIAVISLFLNSTISILLPDYAALYILSVATIAISIIVEIIAMIMFYRLPKIEEQSLAQLHSLFLCNISRNVSHQILTAVSINLLLVEQRSESIATILTVFTSLISVYLVFYYFFSLSAYFMYLAFDRKNLPDITSDQKIVSSSVLIYIALTLVFVVYTTDTFFLKPFLERAAIVYIDLVPLGVYVAYIAVILASIGFHALHHHQMLRINLAKHHRALLEAKKEKNSTQETPIIANSFIKRNDIPKTMHRNPVNRMMEHHTTDSFLSALDGISTF